VSLEFKRGRMISTVDTVSNGHRTTGRAAQPTGRADRTAPRARDASTGRAPRSDRTRQSQRPVGVLRGRTRQIACDRTRRVSAQPFATHYSSGCPTGRSGSAKDRTRQLQTLARTPDCSVVLTGHVRSNRDRVRSSIRLRW
jgi:hypothetical protein